MNEELARNVGVLAGKSGHDDIVDVSVVEGAVRRGDAVVTLESDPHSDGRRRHRCQTANRINLSAAYGGCPWALRLRELTSAPGAVTLALRSADESVDRVVETTGQLFRLRMLSVQDALESEAIDEGDDLVGQPVQVDAG